MLITMLLKYCCLSWHPQCRTVRMVCKCGQVVYRQKHTEGLIGFWHPSSSSCHFPSNVKVEKSSSFLLLILRERYSEKTCKAFVKTNRAA